MNSNPNLVSMRTLRSHLENVKLHQQFRNYPVEIMLINSARHFQKTHALSFLLVAVGVTHLNAADEWREPFTPDPHTVVLYHFDEGKGNFFGKIGEIRISNVRRYGR
jgi:hypothetical protein